MIQELQQTHFLDKSCDPPDNTELRTALMLLRCERQHLICNNTMRESVDGCVLASREKERTPFNLQHHLTQRWRPGNIPRFLFFGRNLPKQSGNVCLNVLRSFNVGLSRRFIEQGYKSAPKPNHTVGNVSRISFIFCFFSRSQGSPTGLLRF